MRFRSLLVALAVLVAVAPGCKKKKDKDKDKDTPAADIAPAPEGPAPGSEGPSDVNAGAFSIPKTTFARGEAIPVTYNRDMTAPPGQQHWITLAKPTDVESAWGVWHYVKQSATTDSLVAPTAGQWEIRLHDVYPRYASRVLARQIITVN